MTFCHQQTDKPEYVLIHDAARPFVTDAIITDIISAVTIHGACTAAIACSDTVNTVNGGTLGETLDRGQLALIQTPQAARFDWLYSAHELACKNGSATTDDASVLQAAGHKVYTIKGSSYNIKITEPADLVLAEAIASRH
jgi:2-C-methyl-D-erythritol 4-phosphate cytidylyltransferase